MDLFEFIKDLGPVIVSIVALVLSYFLTKKGLETQEEISRNGINSQKDAETRNLINKQLNEFYGPIIQLRKKSKNLYIKLRELEGNSGEDFSTLIYLMEGNTFSGNSKIILEEIINLGKETENLIHAKSGLIDDLELRQDLIPRATTHFLLIRLAYEGKLSGGSEKFDSLIFPRDLDSKLEEINSQLLNSLKYLNKRN